MTPLISCLLTTRSARWGCLQRAIMDFAAQDYPNKELIITTAEVAYAGNIMSFLTQHPEIAKDVQLYVRSVARTARDGYLMALCQARGDYVTLWDDANLNAPNRLSKQMAVQVQHPQAMTALRQGLYFFYETAELFVVDFEQPAGAPSRRCCANTVIVPRRIFPQIDHTWAKSPVSQLIDYADRSGVPLLMLAGAPFSHVVGVAGGEMRPDHRQLAAELPGVASVAQLQADRARISLALDIYAWPGLVAVSGPEGVAFEHTPARVWQGLYPVRIAEDPTVEKITEVVTEEQGADNAAK